MILFPHRPLRAVTVAVVALALGLAGCAGGLPGPWVSAGRAVTPSPGAIQPPMARGPFVSAANPLAVEAGLKILREGGSAVELIPYDQAYGPGFEDMQRRVPDTTKLRDLTGWVPSHSLDDVLTDAIAQARHDLDLHPEPVSA